MNTEEEEEPFVCFKIHHYIHFGQPYLKAMLELCDIYSKDTGVVYICGAIMDYNMKKLRLLLKHAKSYIIRFAIKIKDFTDKNFIDGLIGYSIQELKAQVQANNEQAKAQEQTKAQTKKNEIGF